MFSVCVSHQTCPVTVGPLPPGHRCVLGGPGKNADLLCTPRIIASGGSKSYLHSRVHSSPLRNEQISEMGSTQPRNNTQPGRGGHSGAGYDVEEA